MTARSYVTWQCYSFVMDSAHKKRKKENREEKPTFLSFASNGVEHSSRLHPPNLNRNIAYLMMIQRRKREEKILFHRSILFFPIRFKRRFTCTLKVAYKMKSKIHMSCLFYFFFFCTLYFFFVIFFFFFVVIVV